MTNTFLGAKNTKGDAASSRKPSTDDALRWVGDLDHPFYNDERQRFVWYEASAIGFQMLLLSGYFITGVMLWVGGADALPYALAVLVSLIVTSMFVQSFVERAGAEYWPGKTDFTEVRGGIVVALGFLVISGGMRALIDLQGRTDGGFFGGIAEGAVVGLSVGALAGVVTIAYKSRQARREEDDLTEL